MLSNEQIIKEVLLYLDGWAVETDNTQSVNESPYMTVDELQKHANKYITTDEIISFFTNTLEECRLKTNYNNDDLLFDKIVCKIAAGRLWNKYNIHTNIEDEESTFIDNYGKKIILEAEQSLRPFIQQKIRGLNAI